MSSAELNQIIELLTPFLIQHNEIIQIIIDPYQVSFVTDGFQLTALIGIEYIVGGHSYVLPSDGGSRKVEDYYVASMLGQQLQEVFQHGDHLAFRTQQGHIISVNVEEGVESLVISLQGENGGVYVF